MTEDELNEQLFKAVRDNDIEDVKQAIEDGANVNAPNKYGDTPLHDAAWNEHTEIVKLLKQHGGVE